MSASKDETVLRARDFWASLVLIATSIFFLWKTSAIPLFGANRAGVSGAEWYNSAAIVPLGLFSALLVLSFVLMVHSFRTGGAQQALSATGIAWNKTEALRIGTLSLIMLAYIGGLVPRVDFVLASGLLITALIFGYHKTSTPRLLLSTAFVFLPGIYAFAFNTAQSDWNAHDDDWVTLIAWVMLSAVVLWQGHTDKVLKLVPVIAVTAPLFLVCVMAFGFRQNVPARGGLIFSQIEYHYYVTLRPLWRD